METRVEVRKVKESELSFLREMAIQTFRETFGFDNTETQLEDYFNASYTPSNFIAEYEDDETDTFFLIKGDEKVGFLKVSWGSAQTESLLDDAFEIQRIYNFKSPRIYNVIIQLSNIGSNNIFGSVELSKFMC